MGSSLAGGQRQRVFLARALYRQPRLLLRDEDTANLDTACEAAVSANLAHLPITRIIIAHRPETIATAHPIVRLYEGVLEELHPAAPIAPNRASACSAPALCPRSPQHCRSPPVPRPRQASPRPLSPPRPEEGRDGNECFRQCDTRWTPN